MHEPRNPVKYGHRRLRAEVRLSGTNLLVILTSPGAARIVAFAIDSANLPEVVGTISSEDAVLVATRGEEDQHAAGNFCATSGVGVRRAGLIGPAERCAPRRDRFE